MRPVPVGHGLLVLVATSRPGSPDRSDAGAVTPAPVEDLTYEQAREELVAVVTRLETGGETLEGSLALWERGEALAARCQAWLDGARARLDAAQQSAGDGAGVRTSTTTSANDDAQEES